MRPIDAKVFVDDDFPEQYFIKEKKDPIIKVTRIREPYFSQRKTYHYTMKDKHGKNCSISERRLQTCISNGINIKECVGIHGLSEREKRDLLYLKLIEAGEYLKGLFDIGDYLDEAMYNIMRRKVLPSVNCNARKVLTNEIVSIKYAKPYKIRDTDAPICP